LFERLTKGLLTRSVISGPDPGVTGSEAPLLPVRYRFAAIHFFFDNLSFRAVVGQHPSNIMPKSRKFAPQSRLN